MQVYNSMLQLHDVMASAHNHLAELLLQSYGLQSKVIRSPDTKWHTVQLMRNFVFAVVHRSGFT